MWEQGTLPAGHLSTTLVLCALPICKRVPFTQKTLVNDASRSMHSTCTVLEVLLLTCNSAGEVSHFLAVFIFYGCITEYHKQWLKTTSLLSHIFL